MSAESDFIRRLCAIATHPAARGLLDDAAVLAPPPGRDLVLTHDMIVEGVHFLSTDPPADVAWKLVAVNLSDLAAKGATPLGVLVGFSLGAADWDAGFATGLEAALREMEVALLGGDTVTPPPGAPRSLGLTAIGAVGPGLAPSRTGARPGDLLWATGTIGDAGLGLRIARGEIAGPAEMLARYRRPVPRIAAGRAIAPLATAITDISDGLLVDALRMGAASGCAVAIDLDAVPLSAAVRANGEGRAARLVAATAGDDYELLFAAPASRTDAVLSFCQPLQLSLTPIGRLFEGEGLAVSDRDGAVPLPGRLGYEHDRREQG